MRVSTMGLDCLPIQLETLPPPTVSFWFPLLISASRLHTLWTSCDFRGMVNTTRASQNFLGYLPHSAFHSEWPRLLLVAVSEGLLENLDLTSHLKLANFRAPIGNWFFYKEEDSCL